MSNLFEHDLTVYLKGYKGEKRQVDKDGPLVPSCHLSLRIMEADEFEPVITTLRSCATQQEITPGDARVWIEDLTGLNHGRLDGEFKDHMVRVFKGRNVGNIENCIVNAFDIDHEDLGITFKLLGYGVSKTLAGELATSVGEKFQFKIARAKHWQEQTDIDDVTDESEENQEEIEA